MKVFITEMVRPSLIGTKSCDEKLTRQLLFSKMLHPRPYRERRKSCVFRVFFVLSVAFYSIWMIILQVNDTIRIDTIRYRWQQPYRLYSISYVQYTISVDAHFFSYRLTLFLDVVTCLFYDRLTGSHGINSLSDPTAQGRWMAPSGRLK